MNNLISWLFSDAVTLGGGTNPAPFKFWVPWIAFCAGALLVWLYYNVEGRKRLVRNHWLNKSILDRMTNQFAAVALVGWFVMLGLWAMDTTLFSWRFWQVLWLAWLVIVAGRWLFYFMFKYKGELAYYKWQRIHQQYVSPPKSKRGAARAGAR